MTPQAFAARHPKLWRLSASGSMDGIRAHGLLPAGRMAALAGIDLPDARRPKAIDLTLPGGHRARITDNVPLSEKRLAGILDDDLTPAGWIAMLNERVFLWPDREAGSGNLKARHALGYDSEWHVFDTARLLAPVWDRAEIAPFNTGATIRVPPRRGRATFAHLADLDWTEWRTRRRAAGIVLGLDRVREVTVRGGIPHAADALIETLPA